MLFIKYFSERKVILSDGFSDFTLTADGERCFVREIIEDILDFGNSPIGE